MALFRTISVVVFWGLQWASVNGQWGFGAGGGGGGGGTCTFDLKCYQSKPGCSLIKELPYWRMTPISCEDCLALCQEKLVPIGPYCCRSVVYDGVTKTCDIFAVISRPDNIGNWEGRTYFQPTGAQGCAANKTTTGQTTPAAAVCKDGETAKLIAVKDYAVDSVSGKDVPGVDADGCGKACLSGKLPDGSSFACKAAQFKDGKCTLSQDAPKSETEQKKSQGATFYRLYCFPSDLVKGCPDTFLEVPQKVLVGQNKLTVDKGTLDECIKACLSSKKDNGFVCKSAIFYYNDKKLNCILNVESSKTKPDLFTDAAPDDIEVYFEPDCGGGQRFYDVAKKKTKAFKDALHDMPEYGPWALWNPCQGRKSFQTRFQPCRELNPGNCPRETRSCDPSVPAAKAISKSPGKKTGDDKLIDDEKKKRDQARQHH